MNLYDGDPNDSLKTGITRLERRSSYGFLVAMAELYPGYVRFDFAKIGDRKIPYDQRVDMVAEEAGRLPDWSNTFHHLFEERTAMTYDMFEKIADADDDYMKGLFDELSEFLFRISRARKFEPDREVVYKLQWWRDKLSTGINHEATMNVLIRNIPTIDVLPVNS